MAGIVLICLSLLIFIVLIIVSKKNNKINQSQIDNQVQRNDETNNAAFSTGLRIEDESNTLDDDTDSEEKVDTSNSNDFSSYSPKSYKDDEEYKRMASLVKNIYFSLVTIVFLILGVLYFIFIK